MIGLDLLSNPFFWIGIEQLDSIRGLLLGSVIVLPLVCLILAGEFKVDEAKLPSPKQLGIGIIVGISLWCILPNTASVYKAVAYSTGASVVKTVADSPHIKQLSKTSLKALERLDDVLTKTVEDKG
jgi:hypothetical protein